MSRRSVLIMALMAALFSSCGAPAQVAPTQTVLPPSPTAVVVPPTAAAEVPISTSRPTDESRPLAPPQGGPLPSAKNAYFTAAGNCALCHRSNIDETGNDVSLDKDWRGSMMAQAAVDPYYQAGVSINLARFPAYSEAIQSKCSTCHLPMAHTSGVFTGEESPIFGPGGYLDPQNPSYQLARDGVSCTTCHQIQDQGLGKDDSFSGGFVIDRDTPMGARILYGSYQPLRPSQQMMSMATGFISQLSGHLQESELCATCHNLYTHYVTADGSLSQDLFPEQTPFSEWLHSDYAERSTCQDCHMPAAEGGVLLSTMGPVGPRSPFAQHTFVGGNAYMLGLLKDFGGELGVQSGPEQLEEAIMRSQAELTSNSALLEVSQPRMEATSLGFEITITPLTGHKFPTGYPSRRAWLHVTVRDGEGELVFESGAYGADGSIAGNANDQGGQAYEPHYEEISVPDQVQIYETILTDVDGQLTTVLLAASAYAKDNRLLPAGFDKASAGADIQPKGLSLADEDFSAGGDTVRYLVELGAMSGPFTVEVELLYQSISNRWAMDLRGYDTEQAQLFSAYYDARPNTPLLVAKQVLVSE